MNYLLKVSSPYSMVALPIGYSVIVALTGLPIGYSVIVALTGLPIGYSVIVALTGLPIGYSVIIDLTGLPIGYSVIVALTGLPIGYSVIVALTGLPIGFTVVCIHTGSPKAVKVEISSTKQSKENTLLVAYICCMSRSANIIPGFTCLPLLLIKGSSAMSKTFLSWLHITFDCYTTHLVLHGPELRYLLTQFVIDSGGGAEVTGKLITGNSVGHKVMAVYNSPEDIKEAGLSEITLEVSALDSAEMMDRLVAIIPCLVWHVPLDSTVYNNSLMIKLEQVRSKC